MWEESEQNRQLADIAAEQAEHPQETGRIWEDMAQQLKQKFRNMMREN